MPTDVPPVPCRTVARPVTGTVVIAEKQRRERAGWDGGGSHRQAGCSYRLSSVPTFRPTTHLSSPFWQVTR